MTSWHRNRKDPSKLERCASDPCPLPGHGNDIHADTEEQAYEMLNSSLVPDLSEKPAGDRTLYYGAFFDKDSLLNAVKGVRAGQPMRRIKYPHITFGFAQEPSEGFPEGSEASFTIVGYGNDGRNEGVEVSIPEEYRGYYNGADTMHITLTKAKGVDSKRTADLDFTPLDTPVDITGRFGRMTPRGLRDGIQRMRSTTGGEDITKREFDESVSDVASSITDADWEYLSNLSETMEWAMGDRHKGARMRLTKYLETSPDTKRLRDFLGENTDYHRIAGLITTNVKTMTRKIPYNSHVTVRRALLSQTGNDMTKKRYIASVLFFGGKCCYCGRNLRPHTEKRMTPLTATCEHIDPMDGNPPGETRFGNVALCCYECNSKRGNKSMKQWIHEDNRLSHERKVRALDGIIAFRKYAMYSPMSTKKAKAVEESIAWLSSMKKAGVPAHEISKAIIGQRMRIEQKAGLQ